MGLVIPPAFKKALAKKPAAMQGAILECLARLDENPRHPGLHAHRIQGHPKAWEAYVDRANRVTFHYEAGDLVMRRHCNHTILSIP